MEVLCLNPTIIINKSHHVNKVYRSRDWQFVLRDCVVMSVPSPKKAKITHADLESCYYFNIKTGEMIPMYLEVPCQKCIICRDKKAVEWATRITCEGNYHSNCPWWITLTYNKYNIPSNGIEKRDLQLFFKRLRERVSRKVGTDVRIRFVGVGEYGGNTARPHYHAIVFGLPITDAKETLTLIENAWSHRISYNKFMSIIKSDGDDGKNYTFIRDDVNGKSMYYLRNGFVYVKPAHDNTPLYLAKYMFKPELNCPFGCNPNFCLSSRKNGIGYDYIQEYMEYHRNNPTVTNIEFLNKHTLKLCKFSIPQYFKDYWFPTPSKIIPNEVRSSYEYIQTKIVEFCQCQRYLNDKYGFDSFDDMDSMITDINDKYFFWNPLMKCGSDYSYLEKEWHCNCVNTIYSDSGWFTLNSPNGDRFGLKYYEEITMLLKDYVRNKMLSAYMVVVREYDYLMSLQFDKTWMETVLLLRDKYKGAITQKMLLKPSISVNDLKYQLEQRYKKLKYKDKY